MSNGLDPDQARCSAGPDLDPICLQRLSTDEKIQFMQQHHDIANATDDKFWDIYFDFQRN